MAGDTAVRPVRPTDRDAWEPLWQGYLTFYETSLASDVTNATQEARALSREIGYVLNAAEELRGLDKSSS